MGHPQSGLTAAAALAGLALEWDHDEQVREALQAGRESNDKGIRIVALGHAMGVLRSGMFPDEPVGDSDTSAIRPNERGWLADRLGDRRYPNLPSGLLTAVVATAVRGDQDALDYCVRRIEEGTGRGMELVWHVAPRAFPDDERLAETVSSKFRREERPRSFRFGMGRDRTLADAYGPGSAHHEQVAAAIEDHLESFDRGPLDPELHDLAFVDHGPQMRAVLLERLAESSTPFWAAEALTEHFLDDKMRGRLRSMLTGDPVRASKVANAAPAVFDGDEAVDELLKLLRDLAQRDSPRPGRPDIVAQALIRTCTEQDLTEGPDADAIAAEAISLMPDQPHHLFGDPTYRLAVAFYPSEAAQSALERLAERDDHPVEPFLAAFRHEPSKAQPFVEEAADILRTLPAHLRARLCQLLADRPSERTLTLQLTRKWADETTDDNKSIASLTYHQALLEAHREGKLAEGAWDEAVTRLADEASAYGHDLEARRRAAWVGMCVIGDWSMLDGRRETTGEPDPLGVPVAHPLKGPDITLVQQLASRWEELRNHFGDELLARLSGPRGARNRSAVWDSLARGAGSHSALDRELEAAVANDPELLQEDGVLTWFVSHAKGTDQASQALISRLQSADSNLRGAPNILVMEPERIGLDRDELITALEEPAQDRSLLGGANPALEALAALDRSHPVVRAAWEQIQEQREEAENADDQADRLFLHPQTVLAVSYAVVDNDDIVDHVSYHSRWITDTDNDHYDAALTRNVSHRLRHDSTAADAVRQAVMNNATPDPLAAVLVSLLAVATAPDQALLDEVNRWIADQKEVLAPIVHDHVSSASLPIGTVLTRAIETARKSL